MKRGAKKSLELLGMNEKEYKVIEAIKAGEALRPIDIAKKSGVGRTTVNFLLKKLRVRGVLTRAKVSNHFEWRMAENFKIENRMENLYDFFNLSPAGKSINLPENIGIEVYHHKKEVMAKFEDIIKTAANKRIFAVQGNKSVRDSMKYLPLPYIERVQNWYRKYNVILDGIAGQSSLEFIKTLNKKELTAYENRLVVLYIVSDDFINFNMDLFVIGKTVLILNYEKSLLLIIKNEEIRDAILNMIKAMKALSKKIDMNKFIKALIEQNNSV